MPAWIDIESGKSLAERARARRWARFLMAFPEIAEMRVLDLGGSPMSWHSAPVHPASVTTVNPTAFLSDDPRVCAVRGNPCELPAQIHREHFDLVFSNSVLEHVGGHVPRQRLADNVHAFADRHWVQTPYRYFPSEPHWILPGVQWLPYEARVLLLRRWNRGRIGDYSRSAAEVQVNEIDLIGISQMRMYFPRSVIWYERFAGLVKSLVAIRH
ncbi:class I SAM-dependent methyltransferase [[Mycobacterium] zoologicum]|uniref:class I SAM-dependent methyltransferase n=1 Tax=[Mycobacterium] zoologicum TaxID=2872311 RepID=UPI001CDB1DE5|nr:class I SAM-dependent methyltransferase [Mycolicibacter sp. MYC101]MEB3061548.1 class I SAM-dependent methyltransferase [Mycolicibacter sp. MYC101]